MAADRQIGLAVILVAAFNVSLFSYYSLAPFIFAELRLPVHDMLTVTGSGRSRRIPRRSRRPSETIENLVIGITCLPSGAA